VTPSISTLTPSAPAADVTYAPASVSAEPVVAPATTPAAPADASASAPAAADPTVAPKASVAAKAVPASAKGSTVRAATPKPATTAPVAATAPAAAPTAVSGAVTARQDLAYAVAAATNAQRTAAGLKALSIKTCGVPASFAVKLATEGALYHNNLMTVLSGCGGGTTAGENVARGYSSVAGVTAGWMGSAGHKANILNANYKSIFVGVAQSANGTYYWVENFTG
jgi:uncharacterized protein YkwD